VVNHTSHMAVRAAFDQLKPGNIDDRPNSRSWGVGHPTFQLLFQATQVPQGSEKEMLDPRALHFRKFTRQALKEHIRPFSVFDPTDKQAHSHGPRRGWKGRWGL